MSDENGNGVPVDFENAGVRGNRLRDPARANRQPPHSVEAEQGILGCILLSAKVIEECEVRIKGDTDIFYDLRHRAIYEGLVDVYEKTRIVDVIALQDYLRRRNQLDSVGGVSYLAGLPDAVPSAANFGFYMDMALEYYQLRKMIGLCIDYTGRAYDFIPDAEALFEEFERDALGLASCRYGGNRDGKIAQYLLQHQTRLEEGWQPGGSGLATGFPELDDQLGGMESGEVIVIGASPSVGKTALACNIMAHLARQFIPVGFFSFEMQGERITARLASEQSGVPLRTARKGMDPEDVDRYGLAMKQINSWPIWICEDAALTIGQVRSRARRWKSEHKIKLAVIDYIQLVESGTNARTRNDAITHVSRNCKAMAKELEIVLIVLAQLSREHKKLNRRPTIFDLRESGAIEADADKIILLHKNGEIIECLVEKNRNEARGKVELQFNAPIFRFEPVYE